MESLTSLVNDLGASADAWSAIVNGIIAATAFVGLLYLLATLAQTYVGKQLRTAQGELVAEKDRQLALTLSSQKLETSKAQKAAGIALARAEDLQSQNLRLNAIIAPRRISLAQRVAIADACKKLPSKPEFVLVRSYATDLEAAQLSKQIVLSLRAGHLVVDDKTASYGSFGGFDIGIHVRSDNKEAAQGIGDAIRTTTGLDVFVNKPEPDAGASVNSVVITGNAVTVTVGVKPIKD